MITAGLRLDEDVEATGGLEEGRCHAGCLLGRPPSEVTPLVNRVSDRKDVVQNSRPLVMVVLSRLINLHQLHHPYSSSKDDWENFRSTVFFSTIFRSRSGNPEG